MVQQNFKGWLHNRAHSADAHVEHPSYVKSVTVPQREGSKHTPVGSDAQQEEALLLRPGGGTFFSGSGFLGTTALQRYYFVSSVS